MNNRLKVILVSPYSDNLVGGIINWTKNIVNYYHFEHSEDVDLLLLNNEKTVQVMVNTGCVRRLIKGITNYLPLYRNFKRKISEEQFDIVHICTSASYGLIRDILLVNLARKKRVNTIVHMHLGRIPQILESRGWEHWLFIFLLKRINLAVVMDTASLKALQNAGFNKVCFLPNPLSTEAQQLINKWGHLKREPRKIVFAGHVVASKGVFELVEACLGIEDVNLEILGKLPSNEVKEQIITMAGTDASQWLSIPGNKSFEEVIREMMKCSIFVLPSYTEGFPNVIIEAMACACPIVATPVGAIAEMLDTEGENPCGVCIPVKSVDELRQAIVFLLNNPSKAQFLGDNAQKRANEMYTTPKVCCQLTEIWKRLVLKNSGEY